MLWITPASLATLKARAAQPTSRMATLFSLCDRPDAMGWDIGIMNSALAYLITGNTRYGRNAVGLMQMSMGVGLRQVTPDSGYNCRTYYQAAAAVYSWCAPVMTAAELAALQADMEACADWAWPETNPARAGAWGVNDPGNNYYHGFMGTWLIGRALALVSPKAVGYAANANHRWTTEVIPYLHNDAAGGYLQEGLNYGTSSLCSMLYYLTAAGLLGEPWLADAVRARLHLTTPDRSRGYPGGDQPQNSGAPLTDYDRRAMLFLAAGGVMPGECRWWLDNTSPNVSQQRANAWTEALFYPEESPVVDYTTTQPKTYFMPGAQLFSTRTGWGTSDTQLLLQAGQDMESHGDDATGNFMLFKSDWLCAQAKLASHSGLAQDAIDSNCITFGGANQVNTENASRITSQEGTPAYSFLQADLSPSYPGQVSAYGRSLFFLKSAGSQYLLVSDQWSGNTAPAVFHLQTLVNPFVRAGSFTATSPGASLFGQSLLPAAPPAWSTTPVFKGSDPTIPSSWRLDLADGAGSRFLIALEASTAGAASPSLGVPQHAAGLDGIPCGTQFVGFCNGPGPWTFAVSAFAAHYLVGLKPNGVYLVTGLPGIQTASAAGILSFFASSGPVTVSEQVVPPPPPPPPPPLSLTFASPNPVTSGQLVTVTGVGLAMVAQVRWAGGVMVFTLVNPTTLTFIAPAVTVVTAGIVSAISTGAVAQGPSLIVQPPVQPGHTYSLSIAADGTPSIQKMS